MPCIFDRYKRKLPLWNSMYKNKQVIFLLILFRVVLGRLDVKWNVILESRFVIWKHKIKVHRSGIKCDSNYGSDINDYLLDMDRTVYHVYSYSSVGWTSVDFAFYKGPQDSGWEQMISFWNIPPGANIYWYNNIKGELNYFKLCFVPKGKLTLPVVWNIFRIGQL